MAHRAWSFRSSSGSPAREAAFAPTPTATANAEVVPTTLAERKAARAAKARAAKAAKRAQHTSAAAHPAAQKKRRWTWNNQNQKAAAEALLFGSAPLLTSIRAGARLLGVARGYLTRLVQVAASSALEFELAAFEALCQHLMDASRTGQVICRTFIWRRCFDETPGRQRTGHLQESGKMETHDNTAKVMASLLGWCMVLELPGSVLHILRGDMIARLSALENQKKEVIWACIQSQMSLPPKLKSLIHNLFSCVLCVNQADLHASGLAATRAEQRQLDREAQHQARRVRTKVQGNTPTTQSDVVCQASPVFSAPAKTTIQGGLVSSQVTPAHAGTADTPCKQSNGDASCTTSACTGKQLACGYFHCLLHRIRTAEADMLQLDPTTESFMLHCTMELRHHLPAVRHRLREWVRGKLRIFLGCPSDEVRDWRRTMEPLFFPAQAAAATEDKASQARRHCWNMLVNGDGRVQDELHHWCQGQACCPGGPAETLEKMLGDLGLVSFLRPPPQLWPRRSWAGQVQCAAHILLLQGTHGLLTQCFRPAEELARQRAKKEAQLLSEERRKHNLVAKPGKTDVHEEMFPRRTLQTTLQQCEILSLDAEQSAQRCKDVLDFLVSPDSLLKITRLRMLLQPYQIFKGRTLHRNQELWQLKQVFQETATPCMQPVGEPQAQSLPQHSPSGNWPYQVIHATTGQDATEALQCLGRLMCHRSWAPLTALKSDTDDAELRWRMVSRTGASLRQVIIHEAQTYPWRLFTILADPGAADDVASDAQLCINTLDSLSAAFWHRYSSAAELRGAKCLADLHALALLVTDNTASIERSHACTKRTSRPKEQTHSSSLWEACADRTLRHVRLDGTRWHSKADGATAAHAPAPACTAGVCSRAGPGRDTCILVISQDASPNIQALHTVPARPASLKRKQPDAGNAQPQKKPYKITRRCAWLSANVCGRKFSKADFQEFEKAMADPAQQKVYDQMAALMTGARKAAALQGSPRKRKSESGIKSKLRHLRQNAKRGRIAWDPKQQRTHLQNRMAKKFWQVWQMQQDTTAKARDAYQKADKGFETQLSNFAASHSSAWPLPVPPSAAQPILSLPFVEQVMFP